MPITPKTRKILWIRAGGRCSICHEQLATEPMSEDGPSVFGQECHIVAQSPGGPRAAGIADVDGYDNLILLCSKHHKQVDDQRSYYTVERLKEIKRQHEEQEAERDILREDREARLTEARLQVQRQAIEDTQQALADFWFWGMKALRTRSLDDPEATSGMEKASARLTVTYSRLQDRALANGVFAWHEHVIGRIGAVVGAQLSYEEARQVIGEENGAFNSLCNTLGTSLRELSATPGRTRWMPPEFTGEPPAF